MCGILGVWNQKQRVNQQQFFTALQSLQHRGPDQEGNWNNRTETCFLGHKRLSIIGIENGVQPISNERNNIHVVVNGTFYGYEKIRQELRQKGHCFQTESDSEIAIHLYEEYGNDFIHYLKGEFAFILVDESQNKVILGRDRFGIKPLVYTHQNDQWIFASEAKAILKMGVNAKWNEQAVSMMMNMQYTPKDQSLFEGIKQVRPACLMEITEEEAKEIQYWDVDYSQEINVSEEEAIENIQHYLTQAIKKRLNTELPVACHLSGGIDSAINLGYTAKFSQQPVDCFTASFPNQPHDESEIAKEIAQYVGAKHHNIEISPFELVSQMEKAVYHGESLAINGHLSAKYILNKAVHEKGYKVVLGGEGSDEVFFGYPHLKQDLFQSEGNTKQLQQLFESNSISNGVMIAPEQIKGVPAFINAKRQIGQTLSSLCTTEYQAQWQSINFPTYFCQHFGANQQQLSVQQSVYLWTKSCLANYILKAIGDGTEMGNSVEGRLPFLDTDLVEYVQKLPLNFKIKEGIEKYILRESVKGLIPEKVRNRQKQAFITPPVPLVHDQQTKELVYDILHSQTLKEVSFLDTKKIIQWINTSHQSNHFDTVLNMVLSTYFVQKTLMNS